ncbi:MAG: hypothetical protein JSR21_07925 [Proteobacteria bacterium]|nr:hypothetical protein [Pseudomonadota bacterium]
MSISRRGMLWGGAALAAAPLVSVRWADQALAANPLPVPASRLLAFRLIRHGSDIGSHTIRFDEQGDVLTVRVEVDVLVKFGPIPLARYSHRSTEVWQGRTLNEISATTDKNGTKLSMSGHRSAEGLAVSGTNAARYIAPEDALPTSYWNPRLLNVPMIGTQDGMLVRPLVKNLGTVPVPVASGGQIPATRYGLRGDLDLDLFYDETRTWAGMEFSVVDGSTIQYARV